MGSNSSQEYNLSVYLIDTNSNEYLVPSDNVLTLTMTESVLEVIPKLDMIINNTGSFLDSTPLTDKLMIRVVLESPHRIVENMKDDNYVNAVFTISSYFMMPDPSENNFHTYNISGYLSYPHITIRFSSHSGSSDEVISYISNKASFISDIRAKGSESIAWIQNNNSLNFLYHISERAYIPDDGVFIYCTLGRKMVYTSLYTELAKNETLKAVYDKNRFRAYTDKKLIHYDGYTISNTTSLYNNVLLYGYEYIHFNGNETKTSIINPPRPFVSLYNRNKVVPEDSITKFKDYGVVIDDSFNDSILKGKVQNEYFKHLLFSNTVELSVNTASNVNLFDKISLSLNIKSLDKISEPYSGNYLVGVITHSISYNIPYSKKIILCRYGINDYKSPFVKDIT